MYAKVELDDEMLKIMNCIKNHSESFDEIKELVFTKERLGVNYKIGDIFNFIFMFQEIKNSAINKVLNNQKLNFPEGFVIERLIAKYTKQELLSVEEHIEQIKKNCSNNRKEKRKNDKKITKMYYSFLKNFFIKCEGDANEKIN